MKKKILLLVSLMLLIASVVSASSLHGDYKGNPIVLIKSDGKTLETDEVPGHIVDGHTMVPISILRQLGVSVTWNVYDYSVDVKLPQNYVPNIKMLMGELTSEVSYIEYGASSIDDLTQLSFSLKFNVGENGVLEKYQKVVNLGINTGVKQLRLVDQNLSGNIYFIKTQDVKDAISNKISQEEFLKRIEIHQQNYGTMKTIPNVSPVPTSSSKPSTTPTPTNTSTPSSPQPSSTPVDNSAVCKSLIDDYNLKKVQNDQLFSPFNGYSSYAKDTFERESDKTFAQFGCTKPQSK